MAKSLSINTKKQICLKIILISTSLLILQMLPFFLLVKKPIAENLIICLPHTQNVSILFIALQGAQFSLKCSSIPINTFNCLNQWKNIYNDCLHPDFPSAYRIICHPKQDVIFGRIHYLKNWQASLKTHKVFCGWQQRHFPNL